MVGGDGERFGFVSGVRVLERRVCENGFGCGGDGVRLCLRNGNAGAGALCCEELQRGWEGVRLIRFRLEMNIRQIFP